MSMIMGYTSGSKPKAIFFPAHKAYRCDRRFVRLYGELTRAEHAQAAFMHYEQAMKATKESERTSHLNASAMHNKFALGESPRVQASSPAVERPDATAELLVTEGYPLGELHIKSEGSVGEVIA